MKHTIVIIKNRDTSVSQVLEFKTDVSIIYVGSTITILELIGLNNTRQTEITLSHGQFITVRNWRDKIV